MDLLSQAFLEQCNFLLHMPPHTHKPTQIPPRSRLVFLGFKTSIKGYIILDLNTREVFLYKNVIFHEICFPLVQTRSPIPAQTSPYLTLIASSTQGQY